MVCGGLPPPAVCYGGTLHFLLLNSAANSDPLGSVWLKGLCEGGPLKKGGTGEHQSWALRQF